MSQTNQIVAPMLSLKWTLKQTTNKMIEKTIRMSIPTHQVNEIVIQSGKVKMQKGFVQIYAKNQKHKKRTSSSVMKLPQVLVYMLL